MWPASGVNTPFCSIRPSSKNCAPQAKGTPVAAPILRPVSVPLSAASPIQAAPTLAGSASLVPTATPYIAGRESAFASSRSKTLWPSNQVNKAAARARLTRPLFTKPRMPFSNQESMSPPWAKFIDSCKCG